MPSRRDNLIRQFVTANKQSSASISAPKARRRGRVRTVPVGRNTTNPRRYLT